MFKSFFLELDESQEITGFDVYFRYGWITALVLIIAAVAYTIYLYRKEGQLSGRRRFVMGGCHLLAALVLVLLIMRPVADYTLSQPYLRTKLVMLDNSQRV